MKLNAVLLKTLKTNFATFKLIITSFKRLTSLSFSQNLNKIKFKNFINLRFYLVLNVYFDTFT